MNQFKVKKMFQRDMKKQSNSTSGRPYKRDFQCTTKGMMQGNKIVGISSKVKNVSTGSIFIMKIMVFMWQKRYVNICHNKQQ